MTCTTIRLFMPYTLLPVMPSRFLEISPCLPNRKMMDRDSTNGGERMGRVAMVLKKPFPGIFTRVTV